VKAIEEIPWVWRARIEKALPNEVHIEVTERRPVAYALSGVLFLVDEEGKVVAEFGSSEKLDAPIITSKKFEGLKPGDYLRMEGIPEALEIVKLINTMGLQDTICISEISIDEAPNIHLVAERSGASIVLGSEDLEAKLWRLAKIAEAIGRDNHLTFADLQKVDMRFKSIVPAQFEGG
jgi:cell division septal protein FtsQ